MKPTAVQYPHSLTLAASELSRVTTRHGVIAYALSLLLAFASLVGSVFYKEITHTFGYQVLGVRTLTLWEALLGVLALVWLASTVLGLLCAAHKGRRRTFGVASIGMNLAAALLVACTLL